MNYIVLITRILAVISLLSGALSVFYQIILYKKISAFLGDLKKDVENNPYKPVSNATIVRFNHLFTESPKFAIILIIISTVLGTISILV